MSQCVYEACMRRVRGRLWDLYESCPHAYESCPNAYRMRDVPMCIGCVYEACPRASVGLGRMRSIWRARTRSKHADTPDARMLIVWAHAKRLARAQALEDDYIHIVCICVYIPIGARRRARAAPEAAVRDRGAGAVAEAGPHRQGAGEEDGRRRPQRRR